VTLGSGRFPVSSDKVAALAERFRKLGIRDDDLDEHFVTSGGKGGQNVNKVATCVVLLHRPTGTQVKCQQERSQGLNRFIARQILADKIETALLGEQSKQEQEREKVRRQKRRRSRRSKARMLADKAAHAVKKAGRAAPRHDD
jgi:protein subunit release factor B